MYESECVHDLRRRVCEELKKSVRLHQKSRCLSRDLPHPDAECSACGYPSRKTSSPRTKVALTFPPRRSCMNGVECGWRWYTGNSSLSTTNSSCGSKTTKSASMPFSIAPFLLDRPASSAGALDQSSAILESERPRCAPAVHVMGRSSCSDEMPARASCACD